MSKERKPYIRPSRDYAPMVPMYESGMSLGDISQITGIGRSALSRGMHKLGVRMRAANGAEAAKKESRLRRERAAELVEQQKPAGRPVGIVESARKSAPASIFHYADRLAA